VGAAIRCLLGARARGVEPTFAWSAILSSTGASSGMESVRWLQMPERARHLRPIVIKDIALARKVLPDSAFVPLFELADLAISWMARWEQGEDQLIETPEPS